MTPLAPTIEQWSGVDVSVAEIESELSRLRDSAAGEDRHPHQRTSVMTHVAWVPPEWLGAAERTLEGMAERHPSRTVILIPEPDREAGIDADLAVRCFAAGDRSVCGEVIELHLRGGRASAPGSLVLPLAISDLPVFLRWRGEPPFGEPPWDQLVEIADRLVVDSSEWSAPRYAELAAVFDRTAVSDIAWARTLPLRVTLAGRWPAIATQEIVIRGPRAEAGLLRGWLVDRLGRTLGPAVEGELLEVDLDGERLTLPGPSTSPSDLLSAELDHFGRDPIFEQAVGAAAR